MTVVVVAILLDSAMLVSINSPHRLGSAGNPPQHIAFYGVSVNPASGPPWGLPVGLEDSSNQTARGIILAYIVANPGVYLRELAEDLDLSMGVVQYHVWALTRDGQVEDCRTGRFRRFFGAGAYAELERKVISLLKQGTPGRVLLALSKGSSPTHTALARILGISSQALTWQIGRLRALGVVEAAQFRTNGGGVYELPAEVSKVIESQHLKGLDSI